MPRKLTYSDRKRMIEARDKGSTAAQIKGQFGFKDDRTLSRHMKLAEHEQEARSVRVEILKDALANHLGKIGLLIEGWMDTIKTPLVYQASLATTLPVDAIESDDLFHSLRAHLPSPTLWRNYAVWKGHLERYVCDCKSLTHDMEEEVAKWVRMRRLTEHFSEPILRRLHEIQVEGMKEATHSFSKMVESVNRQGRPVKEFEILLVDGIKVVEGDDVMAYEERYNVLSDKVLAGEAARAAVAEYRDLKAGEPKIRGALRDILIRRDYIMYTCKLCPGQAKPLP